VANFNPFKEYIDSCKIKEKKIKNITPLVCFQLQLGQIPYISASISKHISQRYTSMKELLADLNRVSDAERMALLTQIPLVGKKKALSILEFLGFSQNTPTPTPSSTDAITQEIKNEINDCPSNEL
jgi:DNA polymerase/3'-5' exonuclease PolX